MKIKKILDFKGQSNSENVWKLSLNNYLNAGVAVVPEINFIWMNGDVFQE